MIVVSSLCLRGMTFNFNLSDPANAVAAAEVGIDEAFKEKLIRSLSYFGYDVLPDKIEEAKHALVAMDARSKALMAEIQRSGLEEAETDRLLVANSYQLASTLRLVEDDQFIKSVKKFTDTFQRKS